MRTVRLAQPVCRMWSRSFGNGNSTGIHDREKAAEREYISKTERDQLRALLAKLDKSTDPSGKQSRTKLHVIFEKHGQKLTPEAEADLRAWKNDGNHTPVA